MQLIADPKRYESKESAYIQVRGKEGRVISDDLLKNLPGTPPEYQHHDEWAIRERNFERFKKYLCKKLDKNATILDVGCGNGWMTNAIYKLGYSVTGVDLNRLELEQAERVFGSSETLLWVYADVLRDTIPGWQYDMILLSASCQYFPDIKQLTQSLMAMLKHGGEIHLTDSIFYNSPEEMLMAKKRSEDYYMKLGFPEMADYYFHFSKSQLLDAGYKKMYPVNIFSRGKLQWWMLKQKE